MDIDYKVVIPARYGSTRLPAKPLKVIAGKQMIQWVCENALRAGASEVIAAVDDDRIVAAVEQFGGRAMMTSVDHRSGTDRIAEVAQRLGWDDDVVVVNLQGDEPAVGPELISQVAAALHEHREAVVGTIATPIESAEDLFNPNVVKVVTDASGLALYFSRAPIPWARDQFMANIVENKEVPQQFPYFRHLGLYSYRVGALRKIATSPPSLIEQAESLEQLRAMSLGLRIHVSVIQEPPGHGVDTEEDLIRVAELLSR